MINPSNIKEYLERTKTGPYLLVKIYSFIILPPQTQFEFINVHFTSTLIFFISWNLIFFSSFPCTIRHVPHVFTKSGTKEWITNEREDSQKNKLFCFLFLVLCSSKCIFLWHQKGRNLMLISPKLKLHGLLIIMCILISTLCIKIRNDSWKVTVVFLGIIFLIWVFAIFDIFHHRE